MAQLMALGIFCGTFGAPDFTKNPDNNDIALDVDLAADELRAAGYEVLLLPAKYGGRLDRPLDDFIEVRWVGSDDQKVVDAMWNEIEGIVAKYGGYADMCDVIAPDHVPFADVFRDWP
jgi:hypothetical protein